MSLDEAIRMKPSSDMTDAPIVHDRRNVYNAFHLGTSFCFIFLAFSVAQNFQTSSEHPDEGSTGLGILYACFTFSNFLSSYIISLLNAKRSLFIASLTYAMFVAANIQYNMYALYISSALLGVGASVLWTAQGTFISQCATVHESINHLPAASTQGTFNGIFWSLFQTNQLVGNLLAALLFNFHIAQWLIFVIMTCICGVGCASLLFLKAPDMSLVHANNSDANGYYIVDDSTSPTSDLTGSVTNTSKKPSFSFRSIFASLALMKEAKMLLVIPIIIYSGLSQTYLFGQYPSLILSNSTKFYVLATLGAFDAGCSLLFGRWSDKVGRVVFLCIGAATHLACYVTLAMAPLVTVTVDGTDKQIASYDDYVFFLLGMGMGIGDAVFNTINYAIVGTFYEDRIEHAFAIYKLFQAGSTAVAFIYHPYFSFVVKTYITLISLVVGMVVLLFVHVTGYVSLNHKKKGTLDDELDYETVAVLQHE